MNLRTIENLDVRGKYVLLRDDFNVQIVDGHITDVFRIEQSMPTINALRAGGARIAICAHLGRPKGVRNMEYTLAPVAEYMKIPLIADCLDKDFMKNMRDGDVVLLENVRFYPGEEKNDPDFSRSLADGFDIFVNDAFAVSHRAHASTVGIGGALGTTFNYATGGRVGNSLYEADQKQNALDILEYAKQNNCRVLLPLDKGVAKEFTAAAARTNKDFTEIMDDDVIIDAGVATTERDVSEIRDAATVIWNGTVGMAEWQPTWSYGSFAIARAIAEQTRAGKLVSVVGGGDTVAALQACGVKDDITYVSTGGGAFLEFIEGLDLPGIAVLRG